ncbi:MAG: hypothetical protein H6642_12510 [Caldilineaceae bacterium]|nr:hypothetical protein [Caldilineaceae bacterium]
MFQIQEAQVLHTQSAVTDYIAEKFDLLEKEEATQLERALLEALSTMFKKFDFMLVVDGQLSNVQHEREIVLKLSTFHLVFGVLKRRLEIDSSFIEACKFAGSVIGREYARTVMQILLDDNKLLNYQGFLDFWCRLDTKAAWGIFSEPVFSAVDRTVTLNIKNPLSQLRDPVADTESVTEFLIGYVTGVIDEGFRVLDFIFRQSEIFRLPNESFVVGDVHAESRATDVYLVLKLETPNLQASTDQFFSFYYLKRYHDYTALRRAIEFAVKDIFDIEKESYTSTNRILKTLSKEPRAQLINFALAHNIYQELSNHTHRGEFSERTSAESLIFDVRLFFSEICYFQLSKSVIKTVKRGIHSQELTVDEVSELEEYVQSNVVQSEAIEVTTETSVEIDSLRDTIGKIDVIIGHYKDNLFDLLKEEARRGGESYLDPEQRANKKDYNEKIRQYSLERDSLQARLAEMDDGKSNG